MKKEYKELEVEVVNFAADDVITASNGDCREYFPCECNGPYVE